MMFLKGKEGETVGAGKSRKITQKTKSVIQEADVSSLDWSGNSGGREKFLDS